MCLLATNSRPKGWLTDAAVRWGVRVGWMLGRQGVALAAFQRSIARMHLIIWTPKQDGCAHRDVIAWEAGVECDGVRDGEHQ